MNNIQFRTAYGPKKQVVTENKEPTLTKQSLAENLDVNNIIKRYNKTGVLQQANNFEGLYGEFDSYDLREAMDKVRKSAELFEQVPANIRAQFGNDPGAFIDYATNKENLDQMRKWGLAPLPQQDPEPVIMDVRIVNSDKPKA